MQTKPEEPKKKKNKLIDKIAHGITWMLRGTSSEAAPLSRPEATRESNQVVYFP